jgi:ATP-dependent helicase/DNAse subunit B
VYSYPRSNDKGEEQIASFFLRGFHVQILTDRVRPKPVPAARAETAGQPTLREFLAKRHTRFSASALERFLQCPFQFFGDRTLKLASRPKRPSERLDVLLQGSILHALLARAAHTPPLFREGLFEEVFDTECDRARVPRNYRREAIRLELQRHFERFEGNRDLDLGWPIRTEEKFEFQLGGRIAISGRIDRLDIGPRQQALVIDYKYSGAEAIRNAAAQSGGGTRLQGGIYMLAAERALGLKPAGMLYCGLRKNVTWSGWHALAPGDAARVHLDGVERVRPEDLRDVMNRSEAFAIDAVEAILAGRIAPDPADRAKCEWCDYRDICRIEPRGKELVQAAGS